jgi:hypothetical protein
MGLAGFATRRARRARRARSAGRHGPAGHRDRERDAPPRPSLARRARVWEGRGGEDEPPGARG